MPLEAGPVDRTTVVGGGNTVFPRGEHGKIVDAPATILTSQQRLRLNPNKDHKPDSYEDLQLDFSPVIFSSLERYLPPSMLSVDRDDKAKFMREILLKYLPHGEQNRAQRHRDYKHKIISNYQPLHRDIYTILPSSFFVPSFLKAINENTEESFRSIMSEPTPGIFTFEMFQPRFCELILSEVENFEKWVNEVKFRIMRPNIMNKYGAVLDDFGFEAMLDKLMEGFIRPISKGFHVDDSEVTLNVCLGKQFSGGELFFRGTRCDRHVNSGSQSEEIFDYVHVPGRAVLHRGCHRHGARSTTAGHRINLLLWCRSSIFREMKKYQKDFSSWCGECLCEKKERQHQTIAVTKSELLRKEDESPV
ncbi:hypothetical protein SAY87_028410 [Trapa incisa]|uniref:Fe2OG dioxygenase domain-containing protein n=1 Tax=Trapa incisa TaxID=236973 RepID=A0AAN7L216_9MYRT|nr:hypothetical protein SAY87_028410 [Trapa incisa]